MLRCCPPEADSFLQSCREGSTMLTFFVGLSFASHLFILFSEVAEVQVGTCGPAAVHSGVKQDKTVIALPWNGRSDSSRPLAPLQMEFCPRTLQQVLEAPIPEDEAWSILRGILSGVGRSQVWGDLRCGEI